MNFQELIFALERFWADQGCVIQQPYDTEVGAGTFHPASFLRSLGPEPWKVAYVEPSRRPTDGRYGENPNRLQHYYQYQVIMKPSPLDIQEIYLNSLKSFGIDPLDHDIRAAQVPPQGLSDGDRRAIERTAARVKEGRTNYFQLPRQELTAPRDAAATQEMRDGKRLARLQWQTAYAGDEPIQSYEIWRDQKKVAAVPHRPQTGKQPFTFEDTIEGTSAHAYEVRAVDAAGRSAATADLALPNIA